MTSVANSKTTATSSKYCVARNGALFLPEDSLNRLVLINISMSPNENYFLVYSIGNINAGNAQQNARRERLFIRKYALSAIFFVAGSLPGSIIIGRRR